MSEYQNPVIRWVEYRLPILSFIDHSVGRHYLAPKNLNYWWNFGSLAGIALAIQLATGIVLAMHYVPHGDMAFDSIERIMRDVKLRLATSLPARQWLGAILFPRLRSHIPGLVLRLLQISA